MLNCTIIDDEPHAIDLISHHINQIPFLNLVYTTKSPLEAITYLHSNPVDLIFLDVQMPEMTGIEFLSLLKKKYKVILTTAYKDYAIDGFDNEVIDYLLKPITFNRFLQAAQRALTQQPSGLPVKNDYLLTKTELKGKLLKINLDDIIYIEGLKQYLGIHLRDGKRVVALLTLKDLAIRLGSENFVRIHKSFIICIRDIKMIQGNEVHLINCPVALPIGFSYKAAFLNYMRDKLLT